MGHLCHTDTFLVCHFFHIVNLPVVIFHPQYIDNGYLFVSATPLTVLYRLFWNFAYVFFMVWGYAYGLGIIVRTLFVTFLTLWAVIIHSLYINSWYLLWVQLLLQFCTGYYETLHVFSSWYEDSACDLDVTVRFFFPLFPHCELSHFSPSIYRQWVPGEHNSSYNFTLIFLELCTCFLHSLKVCTCFSYNPCHIFWHFFVLFELCHLLTSDV